MEDAFLMMRRGGVPSDTGFAAVITSMAYDDGRATGERHTAWLNTRYLCTHYEPYCGSEDEAIDATEAVQARDRQYAPDHPDYDPASVRVLVLDLASYALVAEASSTRRRAKELLLNVRDGHNGAPW